MKTLEKTVHYGNSDADRALCGSGWLYISNSRADVTCTNCLVLLSKQHGGAGRGQGRKPHPDPKKSKYRIMLRSAMWLALEQEATEQGVTVNQLVEHCVSQALGLEPDSG